MRSTKVWAVAAVLTVGALLGYAAVDGAQPNEAHAAAAPASAKRVDNFRLADQNLMAHELYRLADAKAVVIITQGNGCPIVRNNATGYKALVNAYKGKGVEFLMLNSNLQDTREAVKAEAKEYGYEIPILMDTNQLVGEQLGVERTAEVFVINPKTWQVVYRGPLDDRVVFERQKAKADKTWTKDAIDALLAGRRVPVAFQQTNGCLINFPERGKKAQAQRISYSEVIAPMIQEKCSVCHQPGGIGPMALTNYQQIKGFAPMIRETIRTKRMPPFHADPSVGKWHDDKSLSPEQIKTLVHWIEAGAPRGSGPDPLAAVKFQAPEWPLGKPDLVLDIPAYDIPATGIVDYQRPYAVNPLTEGRWLRASTIKVNERQAVHHILTGYLDKVPANGRVSETSWGASVGGYAVGSESQIQPDDVGVYLPAGGAVGFQNHYTPFGKAVTDKSQIAFYFYPKDKTPRLMMRNGVIADPTIQIAPNTEHHPESAYLIFPKDALLYSVFPHAHYRGNSAQVSIRYPNGTEKLLVALPKYDFNWQREYVFEDPLPVPAGSKLIARFTYDNSKRNPSNPDSNRVVPWGDQSFDEMLYTAIRYRWMDETTAKQTDYDKLLGQSQLLGLIDDNIDGKVQLTELKGNLGAPIKAAFPLLDADKNNELDEKELAVAMQRMGGFSF
jgi:peroxiredoxin